MHRKGYGLSSEEETWVERKWHQIVAREGWAAFAQHDFWQSPTILPDGQHPNEHRAVLEVYDNGFLGIRCLHLVCDFNAADNARLILYP